MILKTFPGLWKYCINRNILECKCVSFAMIPLLASVLIETYWNVKTFWKFFLYELFPVLIETYWNVKT